MNQIAAHTLLGLAPNRDLNAVRGMTMTNGPDQTRRTFVKTVAYVAPVILTLKATPALAQQGSNQQVPVQQDQEEKERIWSQITGEAYPGGNE